MSPPKNFTIRVPEDAEVKPSELLELLDFNKPHQVGTNVIKVRAVDTDIGSNGAVR